MVNYGGGDLPQPLPLSLNSLGTPGNITFRTVQQTMLSDALTLASVFRLVSHRVFFFGANAPSGQEATHNFIILDIGNTFSFDSLTGYNQEIDVKQYLGFTDRFFAPGISQSIGFNLGQKVAESFVVDASNTFGFLRHDSPFNEALKRAYNLGNTFGWTEELVIHQEVDAENAFGWSNIVSSSASTYDRTSTHSVIKQNLTYHITGGACPAEKIYRPFVGDGPNGDFTPPSETAPTIGTGVVKFEYTPPSLPTVTWTIKDPEFSNVDELKFTRIDRTTRGGDRKTYSDQDWGTTQTLRMRISKLCTQDADEVIVFLNQSNGRLVTFFDWEGRQWSGIILTSNTEVLTDENETTTFELVFEGSLL